MNDNATPKAIIVGVDGSPSSINALHMAVDLARATGAPVEAVTAWQFPVMYDGTFPTEVWSPEGEAEATLAAALETAFPAGVPSNLTSSIIAGPTAGVLIARSKEASMLVVGSRGRGGFRGLLLGSVSTACAQHAHCPVLIMHQPTHSHGESAHESQKERLLAAAHDVA